MSLTFDEYGRPFIILREQDSKSRIRGVDAVKANIQAAKAVAKVLKSSLGPKGMDKMLQSPDGEITITNDGATILDQMQVENQIGRLLVELSRSQVRYGHANDTLTDHRIPLSRHALTLHDRSLRSSLDDYP